MTDIQSEVRPQDNVSQAGSRASNASATKIQALKIKLAFQEKRAQLLQQQAKEQMQNTQQLERMQLQEELAIAEAEAEIVGNEKPPTLSPQLSADFDVQEKQVSFNTERDIINHMPPFQPSTHFQFQAPSSRYSTNETAGAGSKQPQASDCLYPSRYDYPSRETAGAQATGPSLAQAINRIADVSRQSKLPNGEITNFDGDPRSYQRFMQTFKFVVEANTLDAGSRLNLLIQYTSGVARSVIENCVLLNPEDGYERAKQLLKENFGKPYDIARTYISALISGKPIANNDPKLLAEFSRELIKTEDTLNALGYTADINATSNLQLIVKRLPSFLQTRWTDRALDIEDFGREPSFHDLAEFVKKRARAANSTYGQLQHSESQQRRSDSSRLRQNQERPRRSAFATQVESANDERRQRPCYMCEELHPIWNCETFIKCPVDKRIEFVKEKRLCFNCLGPHKKMDCRSKYKCRECHMRHHTLLHDPSYNPQAESVNVISTEQKNMESTSTVATTQLRGNVYLRILPVKVTAGSKTVTTLALLDDGSQTTLCSTGLLKRLHAATKPS